MMNINKLHLFDREAYYFLDNSPRGFIFPHKYKILSLSLNILLFHRLTKGQHPIACYNYIYS